MLLTILIFLIILSILVLIHELGHFFVAKKLGIKVDEFGFGLPPRAFGKKIGETIYSINWLPIGGFVKLYGEDEAGGGQFKVKSPIQSGTKLKVADRQRAFFARPVWQRFLIVVAGVVMNFVLAVVIISYLFGISGVSMPGDKVIITDIAKSSPAESAGLKKGDIIESINGIKITSTKQLIDITRKHLGEKIELKVRVDQPADGGKPSTRARAEGLKVVTLTPRKTYPKNQGPMGISISQNIIIKKYPLYLAPVIGLGESLKSSWLIVSGFGTMLYQLVLSAEVPKGVAGPVGIAQLTGQFVQIGPIAVLSFVALLSLNLAVLNILPIPALDGGRLFFILIEVATRRRVSQKFEARVHAIGMAILLALIALITLHDLIRIFTGQPIIPRP